MVHGKEIEGAESSVTGANVWQRDPLVAGGEDIVGLKRYGRVGAGSGRESHGQDQKGESCGNVAHALAGFQWQNLVCLRRKLPRQAYTSRLGDVLRYLWTQRIAHGNSSGKWSSNELVEAKPVLGSMKGRQVGCG